MVEGWWYKEEVGDGICTTCKMSLEMCLAASEDVLYVAAKSNQMVIQGGKIICSGEGECL